MSSRHLCRIHTAHFWPPVRCWLAVALCLLVAPADTTTAGPPSQPPRTDLYGDPLPAGALARLGTVRFRHFAVFGVWYDPDGKTLLSAGGGAFRRWDATTGKELQRWPIRSGPMACAVLSTDRKVLAVVGEPQIFLYDGTTGAPLHQPEPAEKWAPHALAFSPYGELLASKSAYDALVTLWEVRTGKKRGELKPPGYDDLEFGSGGISAEQTLAFSPCGKYLACASEDGVVRLWEVATGREVRRHPAASHTSLSVAFSPDGKILAWSGQRHICLADLATGKVLLRLPCGDDTPSQLLFSPDGRMLASVHSYEVRLWDVTRGTLLRRLEGDLYGVRSLAFSPNGKTLAAGLECRIRQWDVATGRERPSPGGSPGPIASVALSPNGLTLAASEYPGVVRLWDLPTARERRVIVDAGEKLAFSPDGHILAWCNGGNAVRSVDVATGKEGRGIAIPDTSFWTCGYSAHGALLALALHEDRLSLREIGTGKRVSRFQIPLYGEDHPSTAYADDASILLRYAGPAAHLWETATGRELPVCRVPGKYIHDVAVSPDGKTLALWVVRRTRQQGVDKGSGALSFHEVATGRERWHFGGEDLPSEPDSSALVFAPDGQTLAVLAGDRILFWDVAEGKELRRIRTGQGVVRAVAFAADGRTLASGGLDTTVLLWDLSSLRKPRGRGRWEAAAPGDLDALWSDLAGEDAARASRALAALAGTPAAVPFLADRLRQERRAEGERRERIPRLLAELDSDDFTARRSAAEDLERLADLAEPRLRQALAGRPSAEVRRRVEQLLEKREGAAPSPETLRMLRAVEALERQATPEARCVLEALGRGARQDRLTLEAQASLDRLARRLPPAP